MSVIVKGGGGGKSSGLYVWKKYDKREFRANVNAISTGFTLSLFNPHSGDYVGDFSFVDEDYLIGTVINLNVEYTDVTLTLSLNNKVYCQSASIDSWSYSKTTKTITFNSSDICGESIILTLNTANFNHFLSYVTANDISKYPNSAVHTDGYYYELYGKNLKPKIVTWAGGTDEEIVAMVEAADQGFINLSDYWAVGDTRTVQLSAMLDATGVYESHAAQVVDLVLMHAGGYKLTDGSTCNFVVGQKDSVAVKSYMNSVNNNLGSWDYSKRRTWCNGAYKNALPSTLLPIFKQFKTITAEIYNGTTLRTSFDYFALPAEKEIFGSRTYSNQTEFDALFQFEYYQTASNRIKKLGKQGNADYWWERSPCHDNSANFCRVSGGGIVGNGISTNNYGLAPFGCI